MRKLYFILLVIILSGCELRNIEITGTAPDMDGATITIRDRGKTLFGENIQNGKFHVVQQVLNEPGYYTLQVSQPGRGGNTSFEVYLEPGKYDIQFYKEEYKYPVITTPSKTQNELSIYQHIIDSLRIISINHESKTVAMDNDVSTENLPAGGSYAFLDNDGLTKQQLSELKINALALFADKYPNSATGVHILSNQYESDPIKYYAIFKKLSKEAQSTKEGLKIGEELGHLINLQPDKIAPKIAGTTPDGKEIDITSLNKKIIIIDFWRFGSSMSRDVHKAILKNLLPKYKANDVGVVSVCLSTDRDLWIETIKKKGCLGPKLMI